MYDYIFQNALVYDGLGGSPYRASVAVYSDTIAYIGNGGLTRARGTVDASRMVLAPGFIDIHSHTDLEALRDRSMRRKAYQGITLDISGNCGIGTFPNAGKPLEKACEDVLGKYGSWSWNGFREYREELESGGIGINMGFLQPHSALRYYVLGEDAGRAADEDEIERMRCLLAESLDQGAIGFSTGLYYNPCAFAQRDELIALLGEVKRHDGLFSVHHRCEGNEVLESLDEILSIALECGVRTEISHLKAIGKKNQEKVPGMLGLIDSYREKGLDARFDQYPYIYGSTSLFSLLPPDILRLTRLEQRIALSMDNEREEIRDEILNPHGWDSVYELVGPENIRILHLENSPQHEGKTLEELGKELGEDPLFALFDVLQDEIGLAVMTDITQTEESLETIMRSPLMCFGSDSLFSSPVCHPRSDHAAIELIARYARDRKVLTLEECIARLTHRAAERLGIRDRGAIREGCKADLVLFDPEKLSPEKECNGLEAVLVNGKPVLWGGKPVEGLSGRVIV